MTKLPPLSGLALQQLRSSTTRNAKTTWALGGLERKLEAAPITLRRKDYDAQKAAEADRAKPAPAQPFDSTKKFNQVAALPGDALMPPVPPDAVIEAACTAYVLGKKNSIRYRGPILRIYAAMHDALIAAAKDAEDRQ